MMKKKFLFILVLVLLTYGCSNKNMDKFLAEKIMSTFTYCIDNGYYEKAYSMLSEESRNKFSYKQFEDLVKPNFKTNDVKRKRVGFYYTNKSLTTIKTGKSILHQFESTYLIESNQKKFTELVVLTDIGSGPEVTKYRLTTQDLSYDAQEFNQPLTPEEKESIKKYIEEFIK